MAVSHTIETERLIISPFEERHLTIRYVNWLNDPEVVRFSEQRHRTHTLASCRAFWESFNNSPSTFWAIEEVANGLGHIGNITVYMDTHNQVADVGILLGEPSLHGKGYGSEAFCALCDYLLCGRKARKIVSGTLASNLPMLALMRKARMTHDGVRNRHYLWEGNEMDIVYMALFADSQRQVDPGGHVFNPQNEQKP